MVPALPGPFWLLGCGNMASAMLQRWLTCGLDPAQVTVIRPSGRPVAGVRVLTAPPPGKTPALAMLAMKPQGLSAAAPPVAAALSHDTTLLSILAGTEHASLRRLFPNVRSIVRIMPNTPVALGKGATGLFTSDADADTRVLIEGLMRPLGHAEWIEDEADFDVVAALAGSGPAFLFRFIEALSAAGVEQGLAPAQAQRLAIAMTEGAGALAAASEEAPRQLTDRVASPGGMTRKGLDVLDDGNALAHLISRTLSAAVARGREMAAAAREA